MKRRVAFAAALVFSAMAILTAQTKADVFVEWDGLAGAFQEPSFEKGGFEGINLTRGEGIVAASGDNFNSTGFTVGGDLGDAITNGDYLSFGFQTGVETFASLDDIMVELDRSATGPPTVNLFSSVTGFGALDVIETQSVPTTGSVLTFDLSGVGALQNFNGSVEFRFYFNGASGSTGTSDIEDDIIGGDSGQVGLQINGTSVPEPASAAVLGMFGLGGLAFFRRRK